MSRTLRDEYLARNAEERALIRAGLPRAYWRAEGSQVRYQAGTFMGIDVSAAAHKQQLQAVIRDPRHQILVVSSHPTDSGAMRACAVVVRHLILDVSYEHRVAILDAQNTDFYLDRPPHLVVIHNILENCTATRAEWVRDVVLRFPHAARLIVTATEDPYKFATNRLAIRPTGCCKVRDAL